MKPPKELPEGTINPLYVEWCETQLKNAVTHLQDNGRFVVELENQVKRRQAFHNHLMNNAPSEKEFKFHLNMQDGLKDALKKIKNCKTTTQNFVDVLDQPEGE